MEIIDVTNLECIGDGSFSIVYKISSTRIIKVYCKGRGYWSDKTIGRVMGEEVRLSRSSPHALPVLKIVLAKKIDSITKRSECYYAVIKRFIPYSVGWDEPYALRELLPKRLKSDCYGVNVRKDVDGKIYLIDTQGPYGLSKI